MAPEFVGMYVNGIEKLPNNAFIIWWIFQWEKWIKPYQSMYNIYSIIYICIYMGGCACEPFQWGLIHCNLWQTNHKPLTCLLKGFIYCNDASGKFISVYSNNSPTFYTFNVTCIYFHIIHRHDLIRFGTSKIFSLKKVRNFFGFTFFVLFLILIVLN